MSVASALGTLRAARDAIRDAIVGKGGSLPEGSPMSDYPAAIEAIPAGGGEPENIPYRADSGNSDSSRAFLSIAKAATNLDCFMLDTSTATDFYSMFSGCSSLKTIPPMDTSRVTNFSNMFVNCSSLTTIPVMDTRRGNNFGRMFYNCSSLTSLPALDVSASTYFGDMFSGCSSLTQIGIHGFRYSIDIKNCKLDADALNDLFTQAGTANGSQKLNINGNPGASTCDKTIATDKGWTVTG